MKTAFIGLLILACTACVASKEDTALMLKNQGYSEIEVANRDWLIECRDFKAKSSVGADVTGSVCRNAWVGNVIAIDTP